MHGPNCLPNKISRVIANPDSDFCEHENEIKYEEKNECGHDLDISKSTMRRLSPSFRCCQMKYEKKTITKL